MKLNFFLSITFIVAFSLSCNHTQPKPFSDNDTMKSDKQITPITLHPGEEYIVQLPDLPTAGYNWYYEVEKDWIISVLEQIDTKEPIHEVPEKQGGTSMIQFKIKGLKEGTVALHFFQKRDWEKKGKPVKVLEYQVQVIGQKP